MTAAGISDPECPLCAMLRCETDNRAYHNYLKIVLLPFIVATKSWLAATATSADHRRNFVLSDDRETASPLLMPLTSAKGSDALPVKETRQILDPISCLMTPTFSEERMTSASPLPQEVEFHLPSPTPTVQGTPVAVMGEPEEEVATGLAEALRNRQGSQEEPSHEGSSASTEQFMDGNVEAHVEDVKLLNEQEGVWALLCRDKKTSRRFRAAICIFQVELLERCERLKNDLRWLIGQDILIHEFVLRYSNSDQNRFVMHILKLEVGVVVCKKRRYGHIGYPGSRMEQLVRQKRIINMMTTTVSEETAGCLMRANECGAPSLSDSLVESCELLEMVSRPSDPSEAEDVEAIKGAAADDDDDDDAEQENEEESCSSRQSNLAKGECAVCREWQRDLSQHIPPHMARAKSRCHHASRHGQNMVMSTTPKGYWDVAFPPTQEQSREFLY